MKDMTEFKPFLLGVYGTLKQGFRLHDCVKYCKFVGITESNPEFTMYDTGWYPGLKHEGNTSIHLEVYEVSTKEIADYLDAVEGYPNLYTKEFIKTPLGEVLVYIYNHRTEGMDIVESGNWTKND